jgi:peptide/nickel transport system substrate-binding protein
VKFILDPSTLLANVASGAVDLTGISTVPIELSAPLREQWRAGDVVPYANGWTMMHFQYDHPNPLAIREPPFRRALVHAIDRQQLADEFTLGASPIAHAIIAPDQPEYRSVESSIVKYDYDPRRATQLIEGLGFSRGADGVFREVSGEPLGIKIQIPLSSEKPARAVADFWQRAGVAAEVNVLPPQGITNQVRFSYTGVELLNQDFGVLGVPFLLHSSAAPLPSRNYTAPNQPRNRGSYVNSAYDALLDRYMVAIPLPERMHILAQILNMHTDLALVPGLYYTVFGVMIAKRLQNVPPAIGWDNHKWDVR